MELLNKNFVAIAYLLMAFSCQKAPFLTVESNRTLNFTKDGGEQSIMFTTNREWSITSSELWCKVSPSAGTAHDGNVAINITVDENKSYEARTCTLTIKVEELVESISINQETGLGLIISPSVLNITDDAQVIEIEVKKNVPYTISVNDAGKDWIEFMGVKALSEEKATFSISANKGYDDRKGIIRFTQENGPYSEVEIIQKQSDIFYSISPMDTVLSYKNHTIEVNVSTNVHYEISTEANWVSAVDTKGLALSSVFLSIDENESYEQRSTVVSFKSTNGQLTSSIIISQKGRPIDLSLEGTSNCYIVPVKDSTYCFNARIAGNDETKNVYSIPEGTDAKVIWQVSETKSYANLIEELYYDEEMGKIVFATKLQKGNALVALTDETGSILWSWHLWITDYNPEIQHIDFLGGVILQDRYLGAFSPQSYGLYYQWGRKDPFLQQHRWSYEGVIANEETGKISYSINHPDVYISRSDLTRWDWNYEHTAQWSTNKTIYDPCPPGWKVVDGSPFFIREWPEGYVGTIEKDCVVFSEPLCTPKTYFYPSNFQAWTNYGPYIYSMQTYAGQPFGQGNRANANSMLSEQQARDFCESVRCQRE